MWKCSYSPPRKSYPIPDQNGQSLYPFSDQINKGNRRRLTGKIKRCKNPSLAHTHMAYMRDYPRADEL